MQVRRFSLIFLDASGRPLRRWQVRLASVRALACVATVAAVGLCAGVAHVFWALQRAHEGDAWRRQTTQLKGVSDVLAARVPAAEETLALVETGFLRLWDKSGLGDSTGISVAVHAAAGPRSAAALAASPDASAEVLSQLTDMPVRAQHTILAGQTLSVKIEDTLEYLFDAARLLENTPSIRPAPQGWTSSSFGVRVHPITHVLLMHKGLDIGGFVGMPIVAPADGIVIWAGWRGGYGQVVVIDHGDGLQTHFAHLNKYLVWRGQRVTRGQAIAQMGTTGYSTGPHVHYEVRRFGQPIDPAPFILD